MAAGEPGSRVAAVKGGGDDGRLRAALKKAQEAPGDEAAWNDAEAIAVDLQRSEEVAAAYLKVLKGKQPRATVARLGQRAMRLHEEWLGAEPEALVEVLELVLRADPTQEWAFQRLTLTLSVGQRWDDLLALYDRTLEGMEEGARRRALLMEAAGIAKDFQGNIDRAIGYLEQLFRARPGDAQVAASLERLLERQGNWEGLARVWQARLPLLGGGEARDLRERAAALYLDKLGDGERALAEAQRLLEGGGDDVVACKILERILATESAPPGLRTRAVALLRAQHEKMGREDRIVSALRLAVTFAAPEERPALLRETAERLSRLGDTAGAMDQLVSLMAVLPDDAALRARLAHLATTAGAHEVLVRGLLAAAGSTTDGRLRVSLLLEAAQVEEELLGRPGEAMALYKNVVDDAAAEPGRKLAVLRRMVDLVAGDERAAERLGLIEKVAELERGTSARRAAFGETARLAAAQGETDRAAAAWQKRLVIDPTDREALDALVDLAGTGDNSELLIEALRRRVAAPVPEGQRRADLVRIAEVQAKALGNLAAAIETWREVERRFGEDLSTVQNLRALLTAAERWRELVDRLSRAGDDERGRLAELSHFLGEVASKRLDDPASGAIWFARALAVEPAQEPAREALRALLRDEKLRPAAVAALGRAYAETDDWRGLLDLAPARVSLAADAAARARLQMEAAELAERRAQDPAMALRHVAAALGQTPEDGRALTELLRLAEKTGDWGVAADAVEAAAARVPESAGAQVAAHLYAVLGSLRDERLADRERALAAYEAALRLAPERPAVKAAVVRLAAALGRWNVAVDAALASPVAPDVVERELVPLLEQAATRNGAPEGSGRAMGEALSAAIVRRPVLPRALARDLEMKIAGWMAASPAAGADAEPAAALRERALLRAASHDPTHVPTLESLAEVQRSRPGPGRPLYDTLIKLAALLPTRLEPLTEAADIAEKQLHDEELSRATLRQLLDRAVQLLRAGGAAKRLRNAEAAAVRAVEGLAAQLLVAKDRADTRKAIDLLLDGSRLPVAAESRRALIRRAGFLALDGVGDRTLARDIHRRLLEEDPDDRGAAEVLARLYEEAEAFPDLLAMRKRALAASGTSIEERLMLRLEMARIATLIESQAARVPTLLANLEESPGHPATVTALGETLKAQGRHGELCDVLTAQARKLEEKGEADAAVRLWAEVATLAERPLADVPRAVAAHERVAALAPSPPTLDALARLYLAGREPAIAAGWLEQRLSATSGAGERVEVSHRLADAYVAAGARHRAVGTLERALVEQPDAEGVRTALIALYRSGEAWEALAGALAERAGRASEREVVMSAGREAVMLYQERLAAPAKAVPVLERMLAVAPDDRALRAALAEGLRAAGRPADARAVLQKLLEDVGRRRSRERAAVHHQIAQVARAEGDLKLALENLDLAAGMVLDSMAVQLALAEVAEEAGELPRAEQAYRSLLVLARRSDPAEAPMAASEVLLRLERVARARGENQAAAECFDSAVATAMQNPAEARRLQAALVARGDGDAAISLLEKRRTAAANAVDEARIACELGAVLAGRGKDEQALELFLKAMDKVPEHLEGHALARPLAKKLGQSDRYLESLLAALEQRRRWDDGPRVADLLLRAGDVAEQDLGDLKRAAGLFMRAEQTGSRTADALTALARVSAAQNDPAEEAAVLERLGKLAAAAPTPAAQADILYRLADRQLASEANRAAGLTSLATALERAPDFARALALVRGASIPDEELPRVMPLYEKVARASGNDRMLLDFLERRSATPQATQAEVREGVELALALGEKDRSEALLERAVEIGRRRPDGLRDASWALVELAERRRAAGDLDGAARLLDEGREASGSPRVLSGLRDIAREAAKLNKTALAARILERLRDAYPGDRDVWHPLLDLYAQLGDRPSMERLVAETTGKLLDRAERNLVRMAWARFLLDSGETGDPVSHVLRDVLGDEPAQPEAVLLLADLHEKRGDVNEAVGLLSQALREVEGQGDDTRRATLARRLAELVSRADPAQAKQVYRTALAAPFADPALKRSLQASLLELLTADDELEERATLAEEILAGEEGEPAARRALELYGIRQRQGDARGARRALELGRQRAPSSRAIYEVLEAHYQESGKWGPLVELLTEEAQREPEAPAAAALWRRAARVRREKMDDHAAAAELLRRATAASPGDPELMRELAACLLAMNRWDAAVEEVSRALETPGLSGAARAGLLRLRAEVRGANGDDGPAVADLEEAFGLAGLEVAGELTDALFRYAARCANEGHLEAERAATFRLSEVFGVRGDSERAQDILYRWVESHPEDYEALRALRNRFESDGRWEEAAQVSVRLLEVEQGPARVDAALALAEACERLGNPSDAITALELVLQEAPGHRVVLDRLVRLYQITGNPGRAGALLVDIADQETDEDVRFQALTAAAEILLKEGDPSAAFASLEKAVAIKPKDRLARRLYADASLAAGLYQEASEMISSLLGETRGVASPEMAVLYHRLGRAAAGLGDRPGQLQALKRALDADRKNGDVASELAELAEQLGDDELALRALRAVTLHAQNGPLTPAMAFFRQARIVLRQGDRPRALIFTKRALQEDPELGEAKQFLQELA
jgi:tetratricopeptide (TPR) repeat protein